MTGRRTPAARGAALLLAGVLVAGSVGGCGLRDRAVPGDGGTPAATGTQEASGGAPADPAGGSGAGGAGAKARPAGGSAGAGGSADGSSDGAAGGPAGSSAASGAAPEVSEGQVAAVETLVRSVESAVTRGEAEVSSDG